MKNKTNLVLRSLFGLMLFVFGLNKFLQFMSMPPLPDAAASFMGALAETGYILPVVGIVEIVVGLALITGFFVPLALVILAPISVNIILFHAALDPAGIGAALVVTALNIYFLLINRSAYSAMLKAK